MKSVLQDWVMDLGLRYQGVLVSAVRGCDGVLREDPSKSLTRCYRAEILVAHCGDPKISKSFIEKVSDDEVRTRMITFLKCMDHLPLHYAVHFAQAAEIIGYHHPLPSTAALWLNFYRKFCSKMHMGVENKQELESRLTAEESKFQSDQENGNYIHVNR